MLLLQRRLLLLLLMMMMMLRIRCIDLYLLSIFHCGARHLACSLAFGLGGSGGGELGRAHTFLVVREHVAQ